MRQGGDLSITQNCKFWVLSLTQNCKFRVLWPDAHNMKSPYQCARTDLHSSLCLLWKSWLDKSTIYGNGCVQYTEIGLEKPLISTFSPSWLIPLTISEMEWTTIAGSSAAICNLINCWVQTIELDWIEEYQWVDPPRIWEAVSGEGWIQKCSHFQLDSLFSPRPCTKVMGKKQDGSPLFLYPAFWLAQMNLLLYSDPALWCRLKQLVNFVNSQ